MTDQNKKMEMGADDPADLLLQQLLHLKSYEVPSVERMTKNRHNIMRRVREANSESRWSLFDLLAENMPWLFAEPRYGIAVLFVIFAGLQFLGVSTQKQSRHGTGIYTSEASLASFDHSSAVSTNRISYPKLPKNIQLFPSERVDSGVKFVGRRVEEDR